MDEAKFAELTSRADSDAARAFVDGLYAMLTEHEAHRSARTYGRKTTAAKFKYAVEAFAADLLRAAGNTQARGWTYRSLQAKTFSRGRVGHRQFVRLIDLLKALRLIETRRGFQMLGGFGTVPVAVRGKAQRFRATRKLIGLARRHRVDPRAYDDHFIDALPERPVALRARSAWTYGFKLRGRQMPVKRSRKVDQIESDMRELNEFLAATRIEGAVHRYYIRVFNNGDDPRFDWNMGGRLYSPSSNSYQQLPGKQRRAMKLNGEPVTEIDLSASYVTILLSWFGRSLHGADDPYSAGPLARHDRAAVKQWFVMTLGTKKLVGEWSKSAVAEFRKRTGQRLTKSRAKEIRDAAVAEYPELLRWLQDERSWADLMWTESEALVRTMLVLMREHKVPSLTVHDSLIVPASSADLAARQLSSCYQAITRVLPILKHQHSQP